MWLIIVPVVVLGVVLMFVSSLDRLASRPWLTGLLGQLGGLLVATGLVTFLWELLGRRQFAREVMDMADLSADLKRSGLERATDQYLDDVEWGDLFRDAHRVDIVVAYANTWRNSHRSKLDTVAADPKARIRVFLPDPSDADLMKLLAERFAMDADDVRRKVEEAVKEFGALRVDGGAELTVHLRRGDLLFSCYRFDSRAVITLYSHGRKRQTSVPTLVVGQGSLYQFVDREIQAILQDIPELPSEPEGVPSAGS